MVKNNVQFQQGMSLVQINGQYGPKNNRSSMAIRNQQTSSVLLV